MSAPLMFVHQLTKETSNFQIKLHLDKVEVKNENSFYACHDRRATKTKLVFWKSFADVPPLLQLGKWYQFQNLKVNDGWAAAGKKPDYKVELSFTNNSDISGIELPERKGSERKPKKITIIGVDQPKDDPILLIASEEAIVEGHCNAYVSTPISFGDNLPDQTLAIITPTPDLVECKLTCVTQILNHEYDPHCHISVNVQNLSSKQVKIPKNTPLAFMNFVQKARIDMVFSDGRASDAEDLDKDSIKSGKDHEYAYSPSVAPNHCCITNFGLVE